MKLIKESIIFWAIICLSISSCSEVPEDVRSRTEHPNSIATSEDSLRYVTIKEAAEDVKSFKGEGYKALKFDCTPLPIEAENIYTIEMTMPDSFRDDAEKGSFSDRMTAAYKRAFGKEADSSKITSDGTSGLTYFIESGGEEEPALCSVYANNSFMFTDFTEFSRLMAETSTVQSRGDAETFTELSDEGSKILKVGGKDFDVYKAGKYAEEQLGRLFPDFLNEGESIQAVDAVGVRGNDGELAYVQLRLRHTYEELAVNENGCIRYGDKTVSKEFEEKYIRPSFMIVLMTADDEIFSYANTYYYGIKEKQKAEKIIPLSQAAILANNTLAQNLSLTVREVGLKYVTVLICPEGKNASGGIDMRPMWSFVTRKNPETYFDFCQTYMILVDALDGTVYYCTPDMVEASEPVLKL